MTTGHRIEPTTLRKRKGPKKTATNTRIVRGPFGDQPTKILPIPTFIDDYNHYMGGVDQGNQLRAAFTTHFRRNQKEFFSGAFWAIDLAVYNSYKLHLALNGSKTSSTGKRDPQQHRKWIEDLVDLLFQVDSNDFGKDIDSKPYPKYEYQSILRRPKRVGKEAFLEAINGSLDHLYGLNPFGRKGYCCFCPKKSTLQASKEPNLANCLFRPTFRLDQGDLVEISAQQPLKRERFRGKQTKWWCTKCEKFICKDCWDLYHS